MPTPTHAQQLLAILARESFRLGQFKLSSGGTSDYYIDCRTTTLHAEGGRLTGHAILDLLERNGIDAEAVGGLTMGADPIVSNVATASAWRAKSNPAAPLLHGFLVRKAEKAHGTGRRIEGFCRQGARVVIVDDVCTTGASTINAIEAAREAGMTSLLSCASWNAKKPTAALRSRLPHQLRSFASLPPTMFAPNTSEATRRIETITTAATAKEPGHPGRIPDGL